MGKVIAFTADIEDKMSPAIPVMILPPLLSFEEVCQYLGLGHTIVSEMIKNGEIPHTRARNRIRVYATDLRAYLDSRRFTGLSNNEAEYRQGR